VAGALVLAGAGVAVESPDDETEAFAAALHADIRFVLKGIPSEQQPVICLSIDPGDARQSVTREFVARFQKAARRVVRGAECEVRKEGVVEVATGEAAVLLVAGPIDRVAEDEALVPVAQVKRPSQTWRREYRVVREAERWISLGPVWKMLISDQGRPPARKRS
jgi:hypothetical protein